MKNHFIFRCVAGLVCLYCVVFGLLLNGPESVISGVAQSMLNYEGGVESSHVLVVRMLGAYLIFFGFYIKKLGDIFYYYC